MESDRAIITKSKDGVFFCRPMLKCEPYSPLEVEVGGMSFPDPIYNIKRNRSEVSARYIYVFEYVISGKGYIKMDGKTYQVKAGDFYYLDARHSHEYGSDPDDPYKKIWINVRGRFVNALVSAYYFTEPVIIEHIDLYREFEELGDILKGIDEKGENRQEIYIYVAAKLTEIVAKVADLRRKKKGSSALAAAVKRVIDSSPCYSVTLDELSRRFFVSKSYIIHLFSKEFGVTPKKYILQNKMELAKTLLIDNTRTISAISKILGFSSVQHLSGTFKKYTGFTPDEFRKNNKKESDK